MKLLNGSIHSVNAAALLLGAAGLFSRILGVLRDRLLASEFGAGRELDIYYAAFQIPDFMVTLFILGAGSAAILPVLQECLSRSKEEARDLISEVVSFFLSGAVLLCAAAFFVAPYLMGFIVPGFSEPEKQTATTLTRIMVLSPLFFGLSGIFSSVVQSFHKFLAYAAAPLLYNLGIIVGIVFFVPTWGIKGVAFGVILGALAHLGVMFVTVRTLGFVPLFRWQGFSSGVKRVMSLSVPRVLSLSLAQITGIVIIALGSMLAAGSVSIFQLAQNLYFLPISIFGSSYSVAVFPRLSSYYLSRDGAAFYRSFFSTFRSILFWTVPSAVLFLVLRAHIVRVALGAGVFSWEDTRLTAAVLAILVFSLFAYSFLSLLIKGFYALDNTRIPLVINIFASAVSVALALVFVKLLSGPSGFRDFIAGVARVSDLSDVRVLGIALGFAAGTLVNFFLLYFRFLHLSRERFGRGGELDWAAVLKIVFASVLAGFIAYLIRWSFAETLPLISFGTVLAQGAIAGLVGITVYFGALFLMKEEEVYILWGVLRRKLLKVGVLPEQWDGGVAGPSV